MGVGLVDLLDRIARSGRTIERWGGRLRIAPSASDDLLAEVSRLKLDLLRHLPDRNESIAMRFPSCCWCRGDELFDDEAGLVCGCCGRLCWRMVEDRNGWYWRRGDAV